MTRIVVCTGFSPKGWDEYARGCLQSFHQYWPGDVELAAYGEQRVELPRGQYRDLAATGIVDFIERHADNPRYNGREPSPRWKDGERAAGYSYKWDAVKFCRQLAIPADAARYVRDGEILVWLDADVLSLKPVPRDLVERLLGDADVCYLGRGRKHSEIGFWAVRMSPAVREFLHDLRGIYLSDRVLALGEWHSAHVFDYVRKCTDLKQRDLSPGGAGHVWFQTELGAYMDHLKGSRKRYGRSAERSRR